MELSIVKRDDSLEVGFIGTDKLYILNQELVRDELDWCMSIFHKKMVLNLSGIKQIDTAGLRFLMELNKLYKTNGKEMTITNLCSELEELFDLCKVNSLFRREPVGKYSHHAA